MPFRIAFARCRPSAGCSVRMRWRARRGPILTLAPKDGRRVRRGRRRADPRTPFRGTWCAERSHASAQPFHAQCLRGRERLREEARRALVVAGRGTLPQCDRELVLRAGFEGEGALPMQRRERTFQVIDGRPLASRRPGEEAEVVGDGPNVPPPSPHATQHSSYGFKESYNVSARAASRMRAQGGVAGETGSVDIPTRGDAHLAGCGSARHELRFGCAPRPFRRTVRR